MIWNASTEMTASAILIAGPAAATSTMSRRGRAASARKFDRYRLDVTEQKRRPKQQRERGQ